MLKYSIDSIYIIDHYQWITEYFHAFLFEFHVVYTCRPATVDRQKHIDQVNNYRYTTNYYKELVKHVMTY